jgi:hypothetical protein
MGHHEVEIKRLFADDAAAERFIAVLGVPVLAEKHQVNNIFDTDDGRLIWRGVCQVGVGDLGALTLW